jgi:hypothetical protein
MSWRWVLPHFNSRSSPCGLHDARPSVHLAQICVKPRERFFDEVRCRSYVTRGVNEHLFLAWRRSQKRILA